MLTGNGERGASTYSVDKFVDKAQDKPENPRFMRVWRRCLFDGQVLQHGNTLQDRDTFDYRLMRDPIQVQRWQRQSPVF